MRAKKSNKWLYAVLALALAGGATYFIVKKVKSKKGNTTTRATGLIANTATTTNAASTPNTSTSTKGNRVSTKRNNIIQTILKRKNAGLTGCNR